MQLIKSLRSFGRWLFNIKDEVKAGDVFERINGDNSYKVYIVKVEGNLVYHRRDGRLMYGINSIGSFNYNYRKIS